MNTTPPGAVPAKRLTTEEVAQLLDVSPDKVRLWIRRGDMARINVGTKGRPIYRVTPEALAAFEQARTSHAA